MEHLNYEIPRLGRRIDSVRVTDRAVLVFAGTAAAAEAAAIDLADFHEGCRGLPVLPVVMVSGQRVTAQQPLPFPGALRPILCTRLLLPGLMEQVARFPAVPGFDPARWAQAAYRPVPALLEAACRLYARHDVAALHEATSARGDLARTTAAVLGAIAAARAADRKIVVFVTGAPGAGKTLCGLDLAFRPELGAVFLTGNPALLHVLRAALVRDAGGRGLAARAARQRVEACLQPLHRFRDDAIATAGAPPERVLVIDEAQRCWTEAYARRKTQNLARPLTASEPAIVLDAMARHAGFAAILCLLGTGQEIHAGEGGLAGWDAAVAARPGWHAVAPQGALAVVAPQGALAAVAPQGALAAVAPQGALAAVAPQGALAAVAPAAAPQGALAAAHPRERLQPRPGLAFDPALHLGASVRSWQAPQTVRWVDAVLAGDAALARRIAADGLPVRLTRSLHAMRGALQREVGRGRRAGLVASSGGRRLRAEGLGGLLWHQDEDAVARWFLDRWPDIRSADALEVAGTEFGVQGLELDHVGVCWDTDLARAAGRWQARAFRGAGWALPRDPAVQSNRVNAYRVLLTRARRSSIIWVPSGDARDPTREPGRYDAVAAFLQACGVEPLEMYAMPAQNDPMLHSDLL